MDITIKLSTGSDAFMPDPKLEVGRILNDLMYCFLAKGIHEKKILDTNGNTVGEVTTKESES